jgi:hypothetical protein
VARLDYFPHRIWMHFGHPPWHKETGLDSVSFEEVEKFRDGRLWFIPPLRDCSGAHRLNASSSEKILPEHFRVHVEGETQGTPVAIWPINQTSISILTIEICDNNLAVFHGIQRSKKAKRTCSATYTQIYRDCFVVIRSKENCS